jgi:hypothetical protein
MKIEQSGVQERGKSLTQSSQIQKSVVMTDGLASGFPNMLLWIQLRTSGWEVEQLQARVVVQESPNHFAPVPGGTIQEEQNRLDWQGSQQMREEVKGRWAVQSGYTQRDFLAGVQTQGTVPVLAIALWTHRHDGPLTNGEPNTRRGGL